VVKAIFKGILGVVDTVMTGIWILFAIAYFSGYVQIYKGFLGKLFIVIG
jgi:hypothetical protein